MRQNRQGDACAVVHDFDAPVTDAQYTQTPAQCTERRPRKSRHEAAAVKSVRPYQHVVVHRTARPVDVDTKSPAFNRPAETWQARYPATRRLDERAPFATHLAGYDPDRIACSEYPWTVP